MIISHKYKFIFIKTQKTAGTSIEVFLSQHCGPDDVVTPIIPHVEPHQARNHEGFYNHMPGPEIRQRVSQEVWSGYFKFCVERNPWDKVLSHFHMVRARENPALTLDEYMTAGKFPTDADKYLEPGESKLIVDEIARYESLPEDLSRIFARLGIPFGGDLGVRAKSEYRPDRRPYQEVLTAAQSEQVRGAFAREIELLFAGLRDDPVRAVADEGSPRPISSRQN